MNSPLEVIVPPVACQMTLTATVSLVIATPLAVNCWLRRNL
jgi:hypothetical protein